MSTIGEIFQKQDSNPVEKPTDNQKETLFGLTLTQTSPQPPAPIKPESNKYFKIVLSGKTFYNLMRKATLNGLCGGAVFVFNEDSVVLTVSESVYGCYGVYKPKYFTDYTAKNNSEFRFNKGFIDTYKDVGFVMDDLVTIESDYDNNKVKIYTNKLSWNPPTVETEFGTIGLPESFVKVEYVKGTGYLPVPKTPKKINMHFKTGVIDLPKTKTAHVSIKPTPTSLVFEWEIDGILRKEIPLQPTKIITYEVEPDQEFIYIHEYLSDFFTGFVGEIDVFLFNLVAYFVEDNPLFSFTAFLSGMNRR